MFADALREPYLSVSDATGVLVLAKEQCRHGHFWVLVAPRSTCSTATPSGTTVRQSIHLLRGYKGYLVADEHTVMITSTTKGGHRGWVLGPRTALLLQGARVRPERAKIALAHIGALFRVERTVADAPRKRKRRRAGRRPAPLSKNSSNGAIPRHPSSSTRRRSPPASPRAQPARRLAALPRRRALALDNNISELNLRRWQVVGRRNWLFVGSDDGAVTNTRFVSLLAQRDGSTTSSPSATSAIPSACFRAGPETASSKLAPAYWKQTLSAERNEQKLAANIFRRVLLDLPT